MKALLYLRWTKLKNQIRSIIKKPSRLIYLIFLVACLALTLVGSSAADAEPGRVLRSRDELNALAAALYLLMFVLTVDSGFSRGGNLFSMSDVNLIFPSPIRPQTILFYGLLQQMAASLFIGFFLLFQYTNLHGTYGISFAQLILLLMGYAAAVFLAQVTAMLLYSLTNGNPRRQLIARILLYGILGIFMLYVLVCALRDGSSFLLENAVAAANSTVFRCMPVIGWLSLATAGLLTGNPVWGLLGILLCLAFLALLVFLIFRVDPDYYEDVIKSAELSHSAITAKKEGTMTEATPQKVRLGKTGIGRGWGASVFFYKHLIENRRTRKFLLSTNALIFAATVILFSLFLRGAGILPVFLMSAYMQMFSSLLGRFNTELLRPYIYLIPEPPMKKMLWALAETLPSALLEAVVVFIPVQLIMGLPAEVTWMCVLARVALTALYTSANVVVERLWGGVTSKALVFFLFFLVVVALALPAILAVCVASFAFQVSSAAALLGLLAVCALPTALLALFLCRNMLQYAELNHQ